MPCNITIQNHLQNQIEASSEKGLAMRLDLANKLANQINRSYGYNVVKFFEGENDYTNIRTISIPDELVDKYYQNELKIEEEEALSMNEEERKRGEYTEEQRGEFFQKEGETVTSPASPKVLALVKDFIKRIGVDINTLKRVTIDGNEYDANGVADIFHKLIQVLEGKEEVALPEEAMHFAVEIIKQKNPALYRKLLREINNYRLLQQVFKDYGTDPKYQTKDGKPDVIKLKEEAIAKVLAETIVTRELDEKSELLEKVHSWWKEIIEFFKGLFSTSAIDKVAMDIITGNFEGTAEDIQAAENRLFFQKGSQEDIFNTLKEVASRIELKDEKYFIDGKRIKRRVSELTHTLYDQMFAEKKLLETDHQKAIYDLKAEKGTQGHAAIHYAFTRLVDENGYLRDTPLDEDDYSVKNPNFDWNQYVILRNNLKQRLESLDNQRDKGRTRFMAEITIYDKKRDIAGTIDMLAIKPDGKMNVYDWKFMDLNTEKYDDVPWYKVQAWNQQMTQYKAILKDAYNIKGENFEHTRMIPIQAIYSQGNPKEKILPHLMEIKIGEARVENINEDFLLPVGLQEEKTGNEELDAFLEKLNAVYEKLSQKKIFTEEEKRAKAEQLNALFKAIRQLQVKRNVKPLLMQTQLLNLQAAKLIDKYKSNYEGKNPNSFSEEERSNFAGELLDMLNSVTKYARLDAELDTLFSASPSTEEQKIIDSISTVADKSRRVELKLKSTLEKFTSDFVAKSEGVDKYMSPEKIIRGFSRWFVTTSGLQLKGMEVLYKKANRAFSKAAFNTLSESKKLEKLKERYTAWAKGKGLDYKHFFDIIKKKDKNELIDEFSKDFYSTLKAKGVEKDYEWIRENIDKKAYKEYLDKKLEEERQRILNKPRILSQEELDGWSNTGELPYEVSREIKQAEKLYDISGDESVGWLLYEEAKQFPRRDKWESAEWKELNKPENAPAQEFYDYIIERNKYYASIGYIHNPRTFLPNVQQSFVEKLVTKGDIRLGEQFFKEISIDEGDIGMGQLDPFTGRPLNKIPKYFVTKLEEGEASTDLFRTMSLYNEAAIKYKYVTEIEEQVTALIEVERNKKAIVTSFFGRTEYKDGVMRTTEDNTQNVKLLEDMQKAIIYGQRFIQSETFDQLLFKLGTWGETFNKKLGMKIFPEDIADRQVSVNKSINALNNFFQLNALGLNLLSATSNLFGGTAQSVINAGKYFTKADYESAEMMQLMNKFNGTDQKKLIGALEYFLPLTDNYNREVAKKLSLNTLTQHSIQDALMILMRKSDWHVQTTNFYAFLKNTVVIDGQVVNAREYLRSLPEYENKYAGTPNERREFEKKFEEAVENLVKEKGVLALGRVEDNQFVIPGVDRMSEGVIDVRRKVQQLSKDALGNLSEDDLRAINLNIYGKSFMVFKNWIPRPVDVRLGNMKYNSASDAYEWGRTRMVMRILSEDLLHSIENLRGILVGNEKGVQFMRELYEKKKVDYEKDTGKELRMTETEFMDLVRANVKNQIMDIMVMLSMVAMVAILKAVAPDDDDEDAAIKNQYRLLVRMMDKFKSELSYFYDPTSLTSLVSTGIFPSISIIDNFKKFFTNFMKENWAIATGNEDLQENTKVIKYLMKSFPLANQVQGYMPMFYPELAKDLGIRMNSNYSLIRK